MKKNKKLDEKLLEQFNIALEGKLRAAIHRDLDEVNILVSPNLKIDAELIEKWRRNLLDAEHEAQIKTGNYKHIIYLEGRGPLAFTVEGSSLEPHPPVLGNSLLAIFLDNKHRETLLGDLEEEFLEIAAKHGLNTAKGWYWWQVLRSIGPLLGFGIRRLLAFAIKAKLLSFLQRI